VPLKPSEITEPVQALLAHHDHMTVTLEAWHNSLVDIRVLQERHEGDLYAREILLLRQRDGEPVQLGLMQINLAGLPEIVRLEIQSQALPLGRIMIRHHLLREVELVQLWRVKLSEQMRLKLNVAADTVTYARTARIQVDGAPVVELLEIIVPQK